MLLKVGLIRSPFLDCLRFGLIQILVKRRVVLVLTRFNNLSLPLNIGFKNMIGDQFMFGFA